MALIKCPECGKQVSDTASNCPHCGAPISNDAIANLGAGAQLTTIQGTSKKLKKEIIWSAILFWGGMLWTIASAQNPVEGEEPSSLPGVTMVIGLFWYISIRARIWWHHK